MVKSSAEPEAEEAEWQESKANGKRQNATWDRRQSMPVERVSGRGDLHSSELCECGKCLKKWFDAGWVCKGSKHSKNVRSGNRANEDATNVETKGSRKGMRDWGDSTVAKKGTGKGKGKRADRYGEANESATIACSKEYVQGKIERKGGASSKGNGKGTSDKNDCLSYFIVGIEQDSKFNVKLRMLGKGGQVVKDINTATGAKLRLRGVGSGFKEDKGPENNWLGVESTDPLMLCISAPSPDERKQTETLVIELLKGIYEDYNAHCRKNRLPSRDLQIVCHHGFRAGSYEA
jgi:hypothetical protein